MSESQYQPPGWYHGDGDPAGTKRYWDGELWIGEPQVMPSGPPPPSGPAATPTSAPTGSAIGTPHPVSYPEASQATAALVVGILSLVVCGILGPFAWRMGNAEIAGIDAGHRDPSNRGTAQAGRILGIIATVLLAFAVLFVIVALTSFAALAIGLR